ncbi:MAG: hypothetical protein IJ875_02450 [Solobacterium sp.]|nr:hypothetical protein [Solobacterium sp.]
MKKIIVGILLLTLFGFLALGNQREEEVAIKQIRDIQQEEIKLYPTSVEEIQISNHTEKEIEEVKVEDKNILTKLLVANASAAFSTENIQKEETVLRVRFADGEEKSLENIPLFDMGSLSIEKEGNLVYAKWISLRDEEADTKLIESKDLEEEERLAIEKKAKEEAEAKAAEEARLLAEAEAAAQAQAEAEAAWALQQAQAIAAEAAWAQQQAQVNQVEVQPIIENNDEGCLTGDILFEGGE